MFFLDKVIMLLISEETCGSGQPDRLGPWLLGWGGRGGVRLSAGPAWRLEPTHLGVDEHPADKRQGLEGRGGP